MIELRIVEHELGVKPEIQYRYQIFHYDWYNGTVRPPTQGNHWSDWKTAEWVTKDGI